ncbi:hypothetical protein [Kitasatospora griseola]|uniref:hypothetical protein n=1 Tax=Kitasatospora griseola TaxID=2064 RepID=UPI003435EB4F
MQPLPITDPVAFADQASAAVAQVTRAMDTLPADKTSDTAPPWALTVRTAFETAEDLQACEHLADTEGPVPFVLLAEQPTVILCPRCAHTLSADPRPCIACSTPAGPDAVADVVQDGMLVITARLCPHCATTSTD